MIHHNYEFLMIYHNSYEFLKLNFLEKYIHKFNKNQTN